MVDRATDGGRTPLIAAAARGQAATVELLLESGANKFHETSSGETAAVLASAGGFAEVGAILASVGGCREGEEVETVQGGGAESEEAARLERV